jgi:hypothetical protein
MDKQTDLCKINISFVLSLVGFDIAIIAILLSRLRPANWTIEFAVALLSISVYCLTYAFFVYHTIVAEQIDTDDPEHAKALIRKGNKWCVPGLGCLILSVPLIIYANRYYVAFVISIIGLICLLFSYAKRRI